jgi:putative intracellular protease/amidase
MKRGLVVLLLLAAGVAVAAPLKVGLYADKGCRGSGSAMWAWLIDGSPDAELTLLSGEDLRNGGLSGLDLFVNPGGAGGPQTEAMGEEGMAAVRKFVADGGKYLGTCCGFMWRP